MNANKLYIVMVGLPARGKSTIASRLKENLNKNHIKTRVFNNGQLRRQITKMNTTTAEFYHPSNKTGMEIRERIALINLNRAKRYLENNGDVAILDATNVSLKRRKLITSLLNEKTILFIECINNDHSILEASIWRKITLPEFQELDKMEAFESFNKRILYYESIYQPLSTERNFIKLDSLNNRILKEEIVDQIPYYDLIRDFLVTDTIKNLFLIRHGETTFNLEDRIGGDSSLTAKGRAQAEALARYFSRKKIPVIFTSKKKRTIETAQPIAARQENCVIISLEEFNEIYSGVCECMTYEEIREKMPEVYYARRKDKYNYVYPGGEGYVTMKERIDRGIKKALYLTGGSDNIMIIGHRAVNRMILSHFLYRRTEDVPYIYIPQDKFYHIVATQTKKLFQLRPYQ
ncbi:MAG TPA: 6-phosphofructokinase [Desulfobacterales bacterium]|nr:6-phosphofructokinase [Desulfobacterales bacterium]